MGKWRPSAGTAPRTPFKRALAACVLAVAAGDAAADYEAAVELRSRDTAESMRLLQRAAVGGHAEAQAVVGLAHAQGEGGMPADRRRSAKS